MIARSLLDSFCAEVFLVLFGVFTSRVILSRVGLIQGLYWIADIWLLLALVHFGAMLGMVWCDGCTEVM